MFSRTQQAEKCKFANDVSTHIKIVETLIKDIHDMDYAWGTAFVNEAVASTAEATLEI